LVHGSKSTAALTNCVLLHTVCIQLGQATSSQRSTSSLFDPLALLSAVQRRSGLDTKASCKMRADAVRRPGIFGILLLTHNVSGHAKSMVVWVPSASCHLSPNIHNPVRQISRHHTTAVQNNTAFNQNILCLQNCSCSGSFAGAKGNLFRGQ